MRRCGDEEQVAVGVHVAAARFGIPRLKRELGAFQAVVRQRAGTPDILVVLIDANRVGVAGRRGEVEDALEPGLFPHVVIGTPDPCVERWLLADPPSFTQLYGCEPDVSGDLRRVNWKRRLLAALEDAGQVVTSGGSEFADELVEAMDLYRAGRAVPSLGRFVDELRATLRRLE